MGITTNDSEPGQALGQATTAPTQAKRKSPALAIAAIASAAEAFTPGFSGAYTGVTILGSRGCASGLNMPGKNLGTCAAEAGMPRRDMRAVLRGGEVYAQATAEAETFEFEAEVTKVMDLLSGRFIALEQAVAAKGEWGKANYWELRSEGSATTAGATG